MKFLDQMFGRQVSSRHKWLDDPEDHDGIVWLPQVAQTARLVIEPCENASGAASYVGGNPHLPDDTPWPEADGVPMGFVMQLDCSALPKDLWGGIGPRSGYLSIFAERETAAPRVIHHETRGHIRPAPNMPKPYWKRQDNRGPTAAIRVIAWPTEHRDRNSVSKPESACIERIEDMMPLTWGHAALLLDSLADRLGRKFARRNRAAAMAQRKEDPARPGEDFHLENVRAAGRMQRSATARILRLLRAARRQPADARLTDKDRTEMASTLATTIIVKVTLTDLRPGLTLLGYHVVYHELEHEAPQTLGAFRRIYSSSALAWHKASKDLETKHRLLNATLEKCEAAERFVPPEGIPEYDRAELARAKTKVREDIAALDAFREECGERLSWFKVLRESFAQMVEGNFSTDDTRPFPSDMSDTLREIRTAGAPEIEHYRIADVSTIWRRDCTSQAVLALDGKAAPEWSRIWHRSAAQLAMEDPTLVPAAIREPFMGWVRDQLAYAPHQMGGLPRSGIFHHEPWFYPAHYVPHSQRQAWLAEGEENRDGFPKSFSLCAPPFDGENILLLHLFSDDLLDWHWGDEYSLLLAMPRDALKHGRWDQVESEITN